MSLRQLLLCGYKTRNRRCETPTLPVLLQGHQSPPKMTPALKYSLIFGGAGSFRMCFAILRDRAAEGETVRPQRGICGSWHTQPAWNPASLPSSIHNNVFPQRSLSPSAPACNHIKLLSFLCSMSREFLLLAQGFFQREG